MVKSIPNILTLANLFCGCMAIIYAVNSDFESVFILVILSAIFDFLDGAAARLLKAYSPIGAQLDSLADMVSFGVVPSMVVFFMGLEYTALIIALFSALRLAKFNIDTRQKDSFIGLPVPANALFFTSIGYIVQTQPSLVLSHFFLNTVVLSVLTFLFSYLLVAEIPMFSLKFKTLKLKDNVIIYLFLLASLLSILYFGIIAIPFIIVGYISISIIYNFAQSLIK